MIGDPQQIQLCSDYTLLRYVLLDAGKRGKMRDEGASPRDVANFARPAKRGSVGVAVAARLLANVHGAAEVGENAAEVLDDGANALCLRA